MPVETEVVDEVLASLRLDGDHTRKPCVSVSQAAEILKLRRFLESDGLAVTLHLLDESGETAPRRRNLVALVSTDVVRTIERAMAHPARLTRFLEQRTDRDPIRPRSVRIRPGQSGNSRRILEESDANAFQFDRIEAYYLR